MSKIVKYFVRKYVLGGGRTIVMATWFAGRSGFYLTSRPRLNFRTVQKCNNNYNGVTGTAAGSKFENQERSLDTLRGGKNGDRRHKCCGKMTLLILGPK